MVIYWIEKTSAQKQLQSFFNSKMEQNLWSEEDKSFKKSVRQYFEELHEQKNLENPDSDLETAPDSDPDYHNQSLESVVPVLKETEVIFKILEKLINFISHKLPEIRLQPLKFRFFGF